MSQENFKKTPLIMYSVPVREITKGMPAVMLVAVPNDKHNEFQFKYPNAVKPAIGPAVLYEEGLDEHLKQT